MSILNSRAALNVVALTFLCGGIASPTNATVQAVEPPPPAQGQVLQDQSGNDFMEDVTPVQPVKKPAPIPIDLSRVGVPVDDKGRIVPLIDRQGGPVRHNYSTMETYNEPAWNFMPQPIYNGYGQPTIMGQPVGPPAFGGYPGYPYGGMPGYYRPSGVNIPIGKGFNLSIGSGGYGGYPGYGGYGGFNGYPLTGNNPWYGLNGARPFGTPWGNPYGGYGGPFGMSVPMVGGTLTNDITTTSNADGSTTVNQNGSISPGLVGSMFGGNPFGGGMFGGSNFSPNYGSGFGLNLTPKTTFQSSTTYTPLHVDLDSP